MNSGGECTLDGPEKNVSAMHYAVLRHIASVIIRTDGVQRAGCCLLSVISFLLLLQVASANLVTNEGFEVGTGTAAAGWNTWTDAGRESWAAESGSYGMAFYGWNTGGGGIYTAPDISASETNLTYYFRIRMLKEAQFADTPLTMKLEFYQSNSATKISESTNTFNSSMVGTSWASYEWSGNAPASAVLAKVRPVIAWEARTPMTWGSRSMKLDNVSVWNRTQTYPVGSIVEEFAYDPWSDVTGSDRGSPEWDGAWAGYGAVWNDDGNLPVPTNYPAVRGNRLKMNASGVTYSGAERDVDEISTGTFYVAYMMNYNGSITSDDGVQLMLNDGTGEDVRLGLKGSSTLSIEYNGVSTSNGSYIVNSGSGNDYLIVGKFDFTTRKFQANAYHSGTAPVPLTEPSSWDAENTLGGANFSKLAEIQPACYQVSTGPNDVYYDEIRIARTWKEMLALEQPIWDGLGSSGDWGNVSNWVGNVVPPTSSNVTFYEGISSGTNINLNGNRTVAGLRFDANADTSLNIRSNTLTIGAGGIAVASGADGAHQISSAIAMSASQKWTNESSAALSVKGTVSGSVPLTKAGSGRLNLYGVNGYTGKTEIQGGSIAIGADRNLGAVPASTPDHILFNNASACLYITNSFTLSGNRGITLTSNGKIDVGSGFTLTYAGDFAGTGEFTKDGAGTLDTGTGTDFAASKVYVNAGTLVLDNTLPLDGADILYLGATSGSEPATLEFSESSFTNQIEVRETGTGARTLEATGSSGTRTFSGKVSLKNDLALIANSGAAAVFGGGLDMSASGNNDFTLTGENDVEISGTIEADTSAAELNHAGSGTLELSADNATSVANLMKINISGGGVLQIDDKENLGDDSGSAYNDRMNFITSGGTLYNTSDVELDANFGLTIGDGAFANFEVGAGSTIDLKINNSIEDGGANDGVVVKTGPGTLWMLGANSYGGDTHISNGAVRIISDSSFGTGGNITLNGGKIYAGATTTLSSSRDMTLGSGGATFGGLSTAHLTYGGEISGTGSFTKEDSNNLILSGVNTFTGTINIDSGQLRFYSDDNLGNDANDINLSGGSTLYRPFDGDATVTLASTRDIALGTGGGIISVYTGRKVVIPGVISGANLLTKSGSGALELTGNNTYSAGVAVSFGDLKGSTASLLGDISTVISSSDITFSQDTDGTYSSVISGVGAVNKEGTGNVTFSGANTYSGATSVSNGTLTVSGSAANSAFSVISGATLGGDGAIDALTLAGTVDPSDGDDIATLAIDTTLAMNGAGTFMLDFGNVDGSPGANWDLLSAAGAVTVAATSGNRFVIELHDDAISGWDSSQSYDWTIVSGGSLVSFSYDKFTVDSSDWPSKAGGIFSVTNSGNNIVLHFEPAGNYPPASDCYVTNAGPESMSVKWTAPYSTTDVLVVRRQGGVPDTPVSNARYTNFQWYGSGSETLVVYHGRDLSAEDMELYPETSYSYAVYVCYSNGSSRYYAGPGELKPGAVLTNTTTTFYDFDLPLDSFAYLSPQPITTEHGGTNWTDHWVHDYGAANMWENSMSMPGNTLPSYGNKLRLDPSPIGASDRNSALHRDFEHIDSGVFYLQFAMNMQSNNSYRYAQVILCDTNEGTIEEKMAFGVPGQTNAIGIQRHWVDGNTTNWHQEDSTRVVETEQDYLCVAKIDFDQQKVWLTGYPHTSILPSQEPADANWGVSYDFPADWFTNLCMMKLTAGGYNNQNSGTVYFDEIRMGRYWSNLTVSSSTPTNWAIWDGEAIAYDSALYSVDLNWEPNARPTNGATLLFTGSQSLYPTNDYGATSQWKSIWFTNTASSFTLCGDGSYIRDKIENRTAVEQTIQQVITFNGQYTGAIRPFSGDIVMDYDVYLETNLTLQISGGYGHTVTFNDSILDGAGSTTSALWIVDNNVVVFNHATWYAGDTIIGGGELRTSGDNYINDASDIIVSNGATFNLNGNTEGVGTVSGDGNIALGAGRLTLCALASNTFSGIISGSGGGLSLIQEGSLLTLTGINTYTGFTEMTNGSVLAIASDRALGAVPGSPTENIILSEWSTLRTLYTGSIDENRNMVIRDGHIDVTNGTELTYGGVISGTGQLNKQGLGDLYLTGANTYEERTEIQRGRLYIGADENLGLAPSSYQNDHISFNNYSWNYICFTNSFTLGENRGFYFHKPGNIYVSEDQTVTYDGVLTGAVGNQYMAKVGLGKLVLGGNNTFVSYTVNAGTLALTGMDPLDGTTFDLGNNLSVSDWATIELGTAGMNLEVPITVRSGSSGTKSIVAGNTSGTVTLDSSAFINMRDDLTIEANSGGSFLIAGNINMSSGGANILTVTGANLVACSAALEASSRSCELNVMGNFEPVGNNRSGANDMKINISAGGILNVDWVNDFGGEPTSAYTDKVNFTGSGGTLNVTNSINLDASTGHQYGFVSASGANATFSVSAGRTFEIPGVISGAGSMTKSGTGRLTLTSTSHSISGSTALDEGSLFIAGAVLTGTSVSIATNATLLGYGTVPGVVVNGTLSPGSSAGDETTITATGSIILDGGGNMEVEMGNVNGSAGTDWDLLSGLSSLGIDATAGNKFRFDISDANISGFDKYANYNWRIVTATSVSDFDPTYFEVNTSNWTSDYEGGFSITKDFTGLYLSYSIAPPPDPAPGSFTVSPYSSAINSMAFALNANSDDIVIVRNETGVFTTPSGDVPAVGGALAGGTVTYFGDVSPQLDDGLDGNTTYYYKLFAVYGTRLYSGTGLTANALSYPYAPSADAASSVQPLEFRANWSAPVDGASSYRFTAFDAEWEEFSGSMSQTWVGDTAKFSVLTDSTTPSGGATTDGGFLGANLAAGDATLLTASTETNFWMFSLASGDFDPSAANNFGVILMSDTSFTGSPDEANFDGYYLCIGNNSTPDKIRLYKSSGADQEYIAEFPDSPEFTTGALKNGLNVVVTRDAHGVFELFYSTGFEFGSLPTTSAGQLTNDDVSVSSTAYFGVYQEFTTVDAPYRTYFDHVVVPTNAVCDGYGGLSTTLTHTNVYGLEPNHKYGYVLRSVNASGGSTNSNIRLQMTSPVGDPIDFTAETNAANPSTSIDLSWTRNGANVMLVRSVDDVFTRPTDLSSYVKGQLLGGDEVIMASAAADSFTDVALDGDTTYYYALYSEYYSYYSTGVTANTTTDTNGNPVVNWSFEVSASNSVNNAYGWVLNQPNAAGTNWGDVTRRDWRSHSGDYINTIHNFDGNTEPDGGFAQLVTLSGNDPGRIWKFSLWASGDASWTASSVEQVVQFLNSGDTVITAFTNALSLGAAATDTFNSNVVHAVEPANAAKINLMVQAKGQGTSGAAQFDDLKLYSYKPQAQNTSGAATPQDPDYLYLGDTNLTFGLDSWGTLDGNLGQARLWIDTNNDMTGGKASTWSSLTSANNKTRFSRQFTSVGSWYWAIQMNYGSTYGTNYWYTGSYPTWADMCSTPTSSLSVTVAALQPPTGLGAAAGSVDSYTTMDLTWTKWNDSGNTAAKDVLIVRGASGATFTAPSGGTVYTDSDTIGGNQVIYVGGLTAFTDSGLTVNTTYDYAFYSVNHGYYSSAGEVSGTTDSYSPTPPTGITLTADGPESLNLAWTKQAGASFITFIVRRLGGVPTTPTDGVNYDYLEEYGTDTKVIYKGSGESVQDLELLADTSADYTYGFYTTVDSVDEYSAATQISTNTMPFYERGGPVDSFAYWYGGVVAQDGGTNWAGAWDHVQGSVEFTNDNLSTIPNYPPAYAGRVVMNPDTHGTETRDSKIKRAITSRSSGVLYVSYVFQHTVAEMTKYVGMGFFEGDVEKMYFGVTGNSDVLGAQYHYGSYVTSNTTFTVTAGETYTVVAKLDLDNRQGSIKGYYDAALPGAEPNWEAVNTYPADHLTAIDGIRLKCGNLPGGDLGLVYYDEVRIATNWQNLVESTNMPVWTGEGSPALRTFGNSTNWYPPYTPEQNMSMIFGDVTAAARSWATNDYGDYTPFRQLWFTQDDEEITIRGNALKVMNKIENASTNSHTIDARVSLYGWMGLAEINPVFGDITFEELVHIDSNIEVRVWGDDQRTLTFNETIGEGASGGNGKFSVMGDSIVVFGATNAYAGATTIEKGELVITEDKCLGVPPGSETAAQLRLAYAGRLNVDISGPQTLHANRGITLDTDGGEIEVAGSTLTVAGAIHGDSNEPLTKEGAGILLLDNVFNDYDGKTIVSNGTLQIVTDDSLGDPPGSATDGQLTLHASELDLKPGAGVVNLDVNRNVAISGTGVVFDVVTTETLKIAGALKGAADLVKEGAGDLWITNQANAFTGRSFIEYGRLIFAENSFGTGDVYINGGANWYLASGDEIFDAAHRVYLYGNTYIECGTGSDLTENGIVGGSGTLNKQGDGDLYLYADNTYEGGTIINGGKVCIDSDDSLGDVGGAVVLKNAKYLEALNTLSLNASRSIVLGSGGGGQLVCDVGDVFAVPSEISGSGMIEYGGGGEHCPVGNNTYTNRTIVSQGTLSLGADSNLGVPPATAQWGLLWFDTANWSILNITNSFVLNPNRGIALYNVNLNLDVATGETLTYNGAIDGPSNYGAVSKREGGRLILGGQNAFTNVLYINGGSVKLTDTTDPLDVAWIDVGDDSGGSSPAVQLVLGDGVTVDNQIHIRTNASVETGNRYIIMEDPGAAELTGGVRLSDRLVVSNVAASTLTLSESIWQTQNQSVSKQGEGAVIFNYTGNSFKWLNVEEGVARSGVDNTLADYCEVYLPGTTYHLDDHDLIIESMSGNGTMDLGNGTLSINNGYGRSTFVTITGAGGFTKTGNGAQEQYTLRGTNDYTGLTTVDDGSLSIYETTNIGSGNILIEDGATLRCEAGMTFDDSRGIAVNNNGQIAVITGNTVVVDGVISGNTMSFYGCGGLTLNAENTFGGNFYINEGTVSVTAANPLACDRIEFGPDNANWEVTLDIGAGSTVNVPMTVNKNDQGDKLHLIRNLSAGVATYAGEISIEENEQLDFQNSGGGTLNIGAIDNKGTKSYLWVGDGSVNMNGVIGNAGTAGIDKRGAGTMVMTAANTFGGGFWIAGGTAVLANLSGDTLSGCDAVYIGESGNPLNATLAVAGGADVTNRVESRVDGGGTVINSIKKISAGDSEFSGELTIAYGLTANNSFHIDNESSGEMLFSGRWNLDGDQRGVQITGDIVVSGTITNGGSAEDNGLVKRGEGTMELNGALSVNFYQDQGNVVIGNGCTFYGVDTFYLGTRDNEDYDDADTYLTFEEAQTFTNGITVGTLGNPTGRRQINFENTVGTVTVSGPIDLGTNANRFLVLSNDTANALLSGNISGTGGLIKQGAGTVRFSANATYADQTKVEEGVLLLDDIDNTASMSVSNGAVLAGKGTVGTVDNYGAIGPELDGTVGELVCSSLQMRDDSQYNCAISLTGNDLLTVNGDVNFGNTVILNVTNIGNGSLFQDMTIIDYSGDSIGSPTWVITGDVTVAMAPFVTVTNTGAGGYWYIRGATPGCNITNGSSDVSADNKIEIEVETVEGLYYDLIYVDAINYSDSLSNSWQFADRLTATSTSTTFTNDLSSPSLNSSYLRFLRVSAMGAWSNTIGRFASEQVYVAKKVQVYGGRNWISLPCVPASPTVSNVFGYRLPDGGSTLSATAVYLYDTGSSIAPTSMIWLSDENHWLWETGGVGNADNFLLPIEQGFMVATPDNSGMREFAVVGALRTNSSQVVVKGHDTMNFLSVSLPRQMHPDDLNLIGAGFRGAKRAMRGDRIYVWDGVNQRIKSRVWMWYKSTVGKWYYDDNTQVPDSARPISQSDAILIYTNPDSPDWTWTNSIYYTPPTAHMAP